jgi:hypothetical protein
MKKLLYFYIIFAFLLAACATQPTQAVLQPVEELPIPPEPEILEETQAAPQPAASEVPPAVIDEEIFLPLKIEPPPEPQVPPEPETELEPPEAAVIPEIEPPIEPQTPPQALKIESPSEQQIPQESRLPPEPQVPPEPETALEPPEAAVIPVDMAAVEPPIEPQPPQESQLPAQSAPRTEPQIPPQAVPQAVLQTPPLPPPPVIPSQDPEEAPSESTGSMEFVPDTPETVETAPPAPIVPSRRVTASVNQSLDILYPGTGWVYLGEQGTSGLVSYIGRKQIGGNTVFTLHADKAGQTLLQFYRSDGLTRSDVNVYVELTITDIADIVSTPLEEAPQTELQPDVSRSDVLPREPSGPPSVAVTPSNSDLYTQTQTAFQAADFAKAAELIEQSLAEAIDDRALFLKGQIYEAKSPVRNIRLSLDAYQQLVNTFPLSPLHLDAQKRITYLRRFYFTIN